MWSLIGVQPTVPAAGYDQRLPVFGALEAHTGRLVMQIATGKNSAAFLKFLKLLLATYTDRHIFLFLDNSSIHHAKVVERFFADNRKQITVIWNAEYAPELNLIERYWKHLKERAFHNYFFGSVEALREAIKKAVVHLNRSKEVRMTVNLEFLTSFRKAA